MNIIMLIGFYDVHDFTAFLFQHEFGRCLGAEKNADQIDLKCYLPLLHSLF